MEKTIEKNCYKNNNNPFFSVIVPTYNVEEYVDECIKSVINQSFDSWELIIIDDGSTDNTADICKDYAQKHDKIIFKQNDHGMQAKARNTGIKLAKGQYICFLDSDDYWGIKHLEDLAQCVTKADCPDMCIANQHTNIYEDKTIRMVLFPADKQSISAIDIKELVFCRDNKVPGATVLNVYKNSFLKENNIVFNEILSLSEDLDFFLQGLSKVDSLCIYDKEYYYYRQTNQNSTIHTIDTDKLNDRLKVCKKWYDYFDKLLENEDNNSHKWIREAQYKLAIQVKETFNDAANLSKVGDDLIICNAKKMQYILKEEELGSYFSEYILTRVQHIVMHYYWIIVDVFKVIVHKW